MNNTDITNETKIKTSTKVLNIIDHIVMVLTSLIFIGLALGASVLPIAKSKKYYYHQHEINDVVNILREYSFTGINDSSSYGTHIHPKYDVTMEDVKEATDHIIDYLYHADVESMQFQIHTDSGDYDFFTEQAITHMKDVKVLFIGGIRLCYVCIVLLILATI